MKTLIIGMDGASIETFKRGWTPYIESLINKGYKLDLQLDLLSRGWVEIFSGKHAIETGALYDLPLANKSLDWSYKFGMEKIPGWGTEIKPIWQVLNERGYKVGIMNVPTTFPAPKVNGFFVSGGGGGAKVIDEATEELCYPKDIAPYLQNMGYIVDQRMPEFLKRNIVTADEVFSRFQIKNKKRTDSFIHLAKEKEIDFGFVVYKTSSVMAEFFTIPELEKKIKGEKSFDENLLDVSKKYYQEFDRQIKKLVESFNEPEVIFVSDHSELNTRYEVNLNRFLQDNGFQKYKKSKSSNIVKYLKAAVKESLPSSYWEKIKGIKQVIPDKTAKKLQFERYFLFDQKSSLAFSVPCGDWCRGIYVNDEERFNGVVSKKDKLDLSREISETINNDKISKMHRIISHVKPKIDTNASSYYPDVIVDFPDGYIVSRQNANGYVTKFEGIESKSTKANTIEAWANTDGISLCVRGRNPIAVSSSPWAEEVTPANNDLTLLYKHILKRFQ